MGNLLGKPRRRHRREINPEIPQWVITVSNRLWPGGPHEIIVWGHPQLETRTRRGRRVRLDTEDLATRPLLETYGDASTLKSSIGLDLSELQGFSIPEEFTRKLSLPRGTTVVMRPFDRITV